jgi:DMSO reductase family type II enzyme heme b subunit
MDDPRWAKAERTDVRLRNVVTPGGEWANPPTVKSVGFRVIANTHGAAFLITWDDPTRDPSAQPDAEADASAGPPQPDGLALALKPRGEEGDVISLQAWPYQGSPKLDLAYWSADTGQAVETVADSYEAVRGGQAAGRASLTSSAKYEDGRWTLMLLRLYEPADPAGAAAIHADGLTAVAFSVWDGGNVGSQAVSPWVDISVRGQLLNSHECARKFEFGNCPRGTNAGH